MKVPKIQSFYISQSSATMATKRMDEMINGWIARLNPEDVTDVRMSPQYVKHTNTFFIHATVLYNETVKQTTTGRKVNKK